MKIDHLWKCDGKLSFCGDLYLMLLRTAPECSDIICCICVTRYMLNNCVRPANTQKQMYAGRVAFCHLVSHVEYAPRALLRLEIRWDGQTDRPTDGRTTDGYITLSARRQARPA